MKPIELPPDLTYNLDQSGYSMTMPAVYGDHAVFGYTDRPSEVNSMADRGPLIFIDLQSLTGSILDKQVNHDILSPVNDPRLWAHVSEDGRFLRYLDGDREKMNVRELDMSTGEVRTVNTTTGHATTSINASLPGDLWRFSKDDLIFDLNGNQTTFTDSASFFRPLRGRRHRPGPGPGGPWRCPPRPVAVLFTDIRGFTGLVERLPPEEVAALLGDYFGVVVDAVFTVLLHLLHL